MSARQLWLWLLCLSANVAQAQSHSRFTPQLSAPDHSDCIDAARLSTEDALACGACEGRPVRAASLVESCVGCICNACATILARCNADIDCKALLDCNNSCSKLGSMECALQCEPVMFEHSSAVGLITQVGECLRAGCRTECNIVVPMP